MSCAMMAVRSCHCDSRATIHVVAVVHMIVSPDAAYPVWASVSLVCTRQVSVHCVSTLRRPRSVKRSSRLFARRVAKTGATAAKRCA